MKPIIHFGFRTRRIDEMIRWYGHVLDARVSYRNDLAAFLAFDEEHHRLAIWTDENTVEKDPNASGIDHVCIGVGDFAELAGIYLRLKGAGILPTLPVNHRFTTSLYYRDPDGNEIEFSVDNFASKSAAREYLESGRVEEILTPPFGDLFDPEELVRMVRSGASRGELAMIGRSPGAGNARRDSTSIVPSLIER